MAQAVSGDPHTWLEAELARVERLADDAPGEGEEWAAVRGAHWPEVQVGAPGPVDGWSREGAGGAWSCDDPYDDCDSVRASFMAEAELVARFGSPAAVLRRVRADRALLADLLAETHVVVDGDCWYTCPAATEERDGGTSCREDESALAARCECGRDARVGRRVRLMAEGWGWVPVG